MANSRFSNRDETVMAPRDSGYLARYTWWVT